MQRVKQKADQSKEQRENIELPEEKEDVSSMFSHGIIKKHKMKY